MAEVAATAAVRRGSGRNTRSGSLADVPGRVSKVLPVLCLVKRNEDCKWSEDCWSACLQMGRCLSHQCDHKGLNRGSGGRREDERHGRLRTTRSNAAGLQKEEGRGHRPRNVNSLGKLEKKRRWALP